MVIWLTPMLTGSVAGMVTASVVGLDRAGPVVVVRVTAAGLETDTAVPLLTVAEADIVIVGPVLDVDAMVVPDGMPGPEMTWPATSPVRLDTAVRTALPAVVMAVGVAVLVTVAFADKVTVAAPITVIVVPAGMPAPVTA
jgi:hypothetical protein